MICYVKTWYIMLWYDISWYDISWHGTSWYDISWYDISRYDILATQAGNGVRPKDVKIVRMSLAQAVRYHGRIARYHGKICGKVS